MTLLDLLVGKSIKVKTDVGTEAVLEIAKVEAQHHSIDLEPATPQNDWWPATKEWDTYDVTFTNGYRKSFNKLEDLQVI